MGHTSAKLVFPHPPSPTKLQSQQRERQRERLKPFSPSKTLSVSLFSFFGKLDGAVDAAENVNAGGAFESEADGLLNEKKLGVALLDDIRIKAKIGIRGR